MILLSSVANRVIDKSNLLSVLELQLTVYDSMVPSPLALEGGSHNNVIVVESISIKRISSGEPGVK